MKWIRDLKIKPLTETQRAYLAGIIDGEGAISVTKKRDTKGMRYGYCFRPVLHVSNTHSTVLQTLQKWTGLGRVRLFSEHRNGWKDKYQWMVWSNQAAQIVQSVLPFLIIKKERAIIFLRFVTATKAARSPGIKGLSAQQWKMQHQYYEQMKIRNKRG